MDSINQPEVSHAWRLLRLVETEANRGDLIDRLNAFRLLAIYN
jgi:hypothetical protein